MPSQNAVFRAPAPEDQLAEALCRALGGQEVEAWRGGEYDRCFALTRGASRVEVVLVRTLDGGFLLAVWPLEQPGWLGRWRGRKDSASADDVLGVAREAHAALQQLGGDDFHWRVDGPPRTDDPAVPTSSPRA